MKRDVSLVTYHVSRFTACQPPEFPRSLIILKSIADDNIFVRDLLATIDGSHVIEDYPNYHKGPAVLVLQKDRYNKPVHVVWGIPKGKSSPAVLVTAYRPDPNRWSNDFMRRKE